MTGQRLSPDVLDDLGNEVLRPAYDRSRVTPGILHLGLGAFHRAHQAVYTDAVLKKADDWGIIGVSLRSERVAEQLNPQQGLFSLLSEDGLHRDLRVIGSILRVLVAPQQPDSVNAAFRDPAIRVVTLTVTEAGYCLARARQSLDTSLPGVQADLAQPEQARTVIGLLARGLKQRLDAGGAPLTVISCDNLANNSRKLHAALVDYLAQAWPEVLPWLAERVRFPCSMVDRIVPAQSEAALARQAQLLGLRDEAAIATEPFSQWIIERDFATPIPDWEFGGALLVDDITPYEAIKLRLLNASHSAIAILGQLAGRETVADVMADKALRGFIETMMNQELMPALSTPRGFDLPGYRDQLLLRFGNPRLQHRCAQIAMDCTEKLRQRWLPTLGTQQGDSLLLRALAVWCYLVMDTDIEINDPRQDTLLAIRASDAGDGERITGLMDSLGMDAVTKQRCIPLLEAHYADLSTGSPPARG